jgi:hypothetical protein
MSFQIDESYIDVAERIRDFRDKHPEGSLQQVAWSVETIADKTFVCYTAAAYRTPADERPGIGTAWEPVPGRTPYTRDSELMNAETSAWGRAIVAALAADTQRIATAQDVRNRRTDTFGEQPAGGVAKTPNKGVQAVAEAFDATPVEQSAADEFVFRFGKYKGQTLAAVDDGYLQWLLKQPAKDAKYAAQDAEQKQMYRAELERRGVSA